VVVSQPERAEHGPISAKTDQQIDLLRDPVLLDELYAHHAVLLACDTEDRDPPRGGPACHKLNG
jgi:hypothetical protein